MRLGCYGLEKSCLTDPSAMSWLLTPLFKPVCLGGMGRSGALEWAFRSR